MIKNTGSIYFFVFIIFSLFLSASQLSIAEDKYRVSKGDDGSIYIEKQQGDLADAWDRGRDEAFDELRAMEERGELNWLQNFGFIALYFIPVSILLLLVLGNGKKEGKDKTFLLIPAIYIPLFIVYCVLFLQYEKIMLLFLGICTFFMIKGAIASIQEEKKSNTERDFEGHRETITEEQKEVTQEKNDKLGLSDIPEGTLDYASQKGLSEGQVKELIKIYLCKVKGGVSNADVFREITEKYNINRIAVRMILSETGNLIPDQEKKLSTQERKELTDRFISKMISDQKK